MRHNVTMFIILFMRLYCIFLGLKAVYRPDDEQHPFNILLDCILPLIVILGPCITILYLPGRSLPILSKIIYIIVIHLFITTPIIHYWVKNKVDTINLSCIHPWVYYYFTLTMIYIYVWGFYFAIVRFARLGTCKNDLSLNNITIKKVICYDYPAYYTYD